MCNRIRGLKEWSQIPRSLARSLINFEYNPNVAPTEQVPAFLAERGKPLATRMARFGINLASSGGKRRPPLLNARTDSLRRGSFKTMLANKRCVIPAISTIARVGKHFVECHRILLFLPSRPSGDLRHRQSLAGA
jgi:putative SOS response-associated peptidase YedK